MIKYYLQNESVPKDAVFLESETVCIKDEPADCDCPITLSCDCRVIEYQKDFGLMFQKIMNAGR